MKLTVVGRMDENSFYILSRWLKKIQISNEIENQCAFEMLKCMDVCIYVCVCSKFDGLAGGEHESQTHTVNWCNTNVWKHRATTITLMNLFFSATKWTKKVEKSNDKIEPHRVCSVALTIQRERNTKIGFQWFRYVLQWSQKYWHMAFHSLFLSIFASKEKKKNTNKIHEPQFMSVN